MTITELINKLRELYSIAQETVKRTFVLGSKFENELNQTEFTDVESNNQINVSDA